MAGSIFQITNWIFIPPQVRIVEVMAFLLGLVALIERTVTKDFTLRRSYFSGPMLLTVLAYFISWAHGCYIKQHVAIVLEVHEAFAIPILFFFISNAFREEEERKTLILIVILAVIPKCFDGIWIWFFSTDMHKYWGVIELWRDGTLLAIGIVSALIFVHYSGTSFRTMKRITLWMAPVMIGVLILSLRRTFTLSIIACAFAMLVTLPRMNRRRQVAVVFGLLFGFLVFALFLNPLEVLSRFSGILNPGQEGSAYIRTMEWPNVLENIWRHPILGTAVGVPWKVYFRIPISSVYTTLGTHNSYLYWPLRAGLLGLISFLWLGGRLWKSVLLQRRLQKTQEDFFLAELAIQFLIIFHVASVVGMMFGDDMPELWAVMLTAIQLQTTFIVGRQDLRDIALWATLREGKIVYHRRAARRLSRPFPLPPIEPAPIPA